MIEKNEVALEERPEEQAPEKVSGDPVDILGSNGALARVLQMALENDAPAVWAGCVTLKNGKVVDVVVFGRVRKPAKEG